MSPELILEYLKWIAGIIALLFGGFFLGNYKKKKSDNAKGDYDNRADMASDFLERLEKTTKIAGNAMEDRETFRLQIVRLTQLGTMHFESCENPEDDFKKYLDFLIKEHGKVG